jgi:hypothetical protein
MPTYGGGVMKKFIRIEELVSRGRADVYYGVLLSEDRKEWRTIAAKAEDDSVISKYEFSKEGYKVEPCAQEKVLLYFKGALNYRDKKLMDAEFELDYQKIKTKEDKELFDSVFGKGKG